MQLTIFTAVTRSRSTAVELVLVTAVRILNSKHEGHTLVGQVYMVLQGGPDLQRTSVVATLQGA